MADDQYGYGGNPMTGLLTGLTEGIKQYMGMKAQSEMGAQHLAMQQEYMLQRQQALQQSGEPLKEQLAAYKNSLTAPNVPTMTPQQALDAGNVPKGTKVIDANKGTNQSNNQLLKVQQNYTTSIKKEQDALDEARTATAQIGLAKDNPVAYSAVPITLSRMMTGTSRININEINRLGGSQAILARLKQTATQMGSGTLTDENAQFMQQLTNVLQQAHQQNIQDLGVHHANQYRRISGKDLSSAYLDVTGEPMPQVSTSTATSSGWKYIGPKK